MQTLKLFHITQGTRGGRPDISYIIARDLAYAKDRYSHYDLDSAEGYEFSIIEELEPTFQNKYALMLRQFVEDFNHWHKNANELKMDDIDKRWNNFLEYLSKADGESGLKSLFDIEILLPKAKDLLEKGIDDIESYINPWLEDIEVKKSKIGELTNIVRTHNLNLILDGTE